MQPFNRLTVRFHMLSEPSFPDLAIPVESVPRAFRLYVVPWPSKFVSPPSDIVLEGALSAPIPESGEFASVPLAFVQGRGEALIEISDKLGRVKARIV